MKRRCCIFRCVLATTATKDDQATPNPHCCCFFLQLHDVEQLPAAVDWPKLTRLQELDLSHCTTLLQLPEGICGLPSLHTLVLGCGKEFSLFSGRACHKLSRLPQAIGSLKATLTRLDLIHCASLVELPASFGSLGALQYLDLSDCSSLAGLPASFGSLRALQELYLTDCSALRQLPGSFGRLNSLQYLDLSGCSSLAQLPDSFGSLQALQKLDLGYCHSLSQLPASFGGLNSLQELNLAACVSLSSLPASFGNLKALTHLSVAGCSKLTELPDSSSNLTALQQLEFGSCPACQGVGDASTPAMHAGSTRCAILWLWCCCSRRQHTAAKAKAGAAAAGGGGGGAAAAVPAQQQIQQVLKLQRHRKAIAKLATQQEPMLTTLERMSWLVVLLGTATFTAYLMPPGGYGDDKHILVTDTSVCAAGADLRVDGGVSNLAFQRCAMLLFFLLDSLSFGLSVGCVMMIVVLSMPRIPWVCEKAEAGRFYLLLSITWLLLYLAVATGFAAFVAAGLSVHGQVKMVLWPVVPGMVLLGLGGVLLMYRFWSIFPGWDAVWASLQSRNRAPISVDDGVEKGQELFWRHWHNLLLARGGGGGGGGDSILAADDVEMQRLLPPQPVPPAGSRPVGHTALLPCNSKRHRMHHLTADAAPAPAADVAVQHSPQAAPADVAAAAP